MAWGAGTAIGSAAELIYDTATDYFAHADEMRTYEQSYDWGDAMNRDYGWDQYGWDYPDYYGFDGWDPGC